MAQDLRVDPADNLNLKEGIYDGVHDAVPQLRKIYNFRLCHSCNYYFFGSYVCETDFLVIELVLDSKELKNVYFSTLLVIFLFLLIPGILFLLAILSENLNIFVLILHALSDNFTVGGLNQVRNINELIIGGSISPR